MSVVVSYLNLLDATDFYKARCTTFPLLIIVNGHEF